MKNFFLYLIRLYQKSWFVRSPLLKALFLSDSSCRFVPTCSQYLYQAVEKYGIIGGLRLSLKRIIRCHPFSKGGIDNIP